MHGACVIHVFLFQGVDVSKDFKALSSALQAVHNITVIYCEPPSKREVTKDILTKNLKLLCEFMEGSLNIIKGTQRKRCFRGYI
jgi:hypothetical protein